MPLAVNIAGDIRNKRLAYYRLPREADADARRRQNIFTIKKCVICPASPSCRHAAYSVLIYIKIF